MKNKGTIHQMFEVWIDEVFESAERNKQEFEEMVADMTMMDELEREKAIPKQE